MIVLTHMPSDTYAGLFRDLPALWRWVDRIHGRRHGSDLRKQLAQAKRLQYHYGGASSIVVEIEHNKYLIREETPIV